MQFNRLALIHAIDKAIEQDNAAIAAVHARNEASAVGHVQEWLSLHSENWTKATTAIRAKLRKGQPVTEDDIPRDRAGYGGKAYYRPKHAEALPVTRVTELRGLRAVLDAVSDKEVSSTGLRSLGVGANTLRKIVPLLGSATVRNEKASS